RYTYHRGPHLGNSVTAALGNYVTVDSQQLDARLSSSNTAESSANLWGALTGSAFHLLVGMLRGNSNHPSSDSIVRRA
ncbi:hypothetical protein, partial [Mycobacterium lacus]